MAETPIKKTYKFPQAIQFVIDGKKITKKEWNNEQIYCALHGDFLCIFKDGEFKQWIINDGDLLGNDWIVL